MEGVGVGLRWGRLGSHGFLIWTIGPCALCSSWAPQLEHVRTTGRESVLLTVMTRGTTTVPPQSEQVPTMITAELPSMTVMALQGLRR